MAWFDPNDFNTPWWDPTFDPTQGPVVPNPPPPMQATPAAQVTAGPGITTPNAWGYVLPPVEVLPFDPGVSEAEHLWNFVPPISLDTGIAPNAPDPYEWLSPTASPVTPPPYPTLPDNRLYLPPEQAPSPAPAQGTFDLNDIRGPVYALPTPPPAGGGFNLGDIQGPIYTPPPPPSPSSPFSPPSPAALVAPPAPAQAASPTTPFLDLGAQFGGPQSGGVFPEPVQQVGQDPLSQLTTGALSSVLLGGGRLPSETGTQAFDVLKGLLSAERRPNRALESFMEQDTPAARNAQLESLREAMGRLQRTQMADARGELAARNLLSEGSVSQGPELSTLGRITSNIAPIWAGAARDIYTQDTLNRQQNLLRAAQLYGEEEDRYQKNLFNAVGLATGLDQQSVQNMLAAADSVGRRQEMLSNLAMRSLDQNMAWNQFLAEYGLKRDQIQYAIEQGQVDSLLPLITAFLQATQISAGGYI